ncbi:hypothetical protein SAMD00019534_109750, partial [Acytostelium subglobosum LB1]|uniref:hypothetical protein n=1 Tax=Acytostelium subglobosum LB1 TaxID=1410327 RepID=UPI000644BC1E
SLTSLSFKGDCVLDLAYLPKSLKTLDLSNKFNQLLKPGELPSTLTSLSFGHEFDNELLPGVLPQSLLSLSFGCRFNQTLQPRSLPSSLTNLNLGSSPFTSGLNGMLPALIKLVIGCGFGSNAPFTPGIIPSTVQTLVIGNNQYQNFSYGFQSGETPDYYIPDSITDLTYNGSLRVGLIPNSVTNLTFNCYRFGGAIETGYIPESITRLDFGHNFNWPIIKECLPSSIKTLMFGDLFNNYIEPGALPKSLTSLRFGYGFSRDILIGELPSSINHLEFGNIYYNGFAVGVLPTSLKTMILRASQIRPIKFSGKLNFLSIPSLLHIQNVHCQVDHLILTKLELRDISKMPTILPVTIPIKTLSASAPGRTFNKRAQFINEIIRVSPNADVYNFTITKAKGDWTIQFRKIEGHLLLSVTNHRTIEFFKMNVPKEIKAEELIQQLTMENDSLKSQLAEANAKLAELIGVGPSTSSDNDEDSSEPEPEPEPPVTKKATAKRTS